MPRTGGRMGGRYYRENEERERAYNSPEWDSQSKPCPNCGGAGCDYCGGDGSGGDGGGGGEGGGGGGGGGSSGCEMVVGCLLVIVLLYLCSSFLGTEKTSVVKFQVGTLALSRSLQSTINRIAEGADTSTPEGLSSVLMETALTLLRHPDYCISVDSSVKIYRSKEDSMKHFNQLSFEERANFVEETLVNVNNIKSKSTTIHRASSGSGNEYLVITILVAAEGEHKLPTINGKKDLKKALQKLGRIPSNKPLAVEVLWTPQNENDTFSKQELLEKYPLLRSL